MRKNINGFCLGWNILIYYANRNIIIFFLYFVSYRIFRIMGCLRLELCMLNIEDFRWSFYVNLQSINTFVKSKWVLVPKLCGTFGVNELIKNEITVI